MIVDEGTLSAIGSQLSSFSNQLLGTSYAVRDAWKRGRGERENW